MIAHQIALHGRAGARQRRPGLLATLLRLDAAFRQRTALSRLDAHLRSDLGLGEADIARELGSRAWDAPGWWLGSE